MLDPESIPGSLRDTHDLLVARIEDASLAVAQPRQQSFYDGWLLRNSPGKAKRACCINALGAGDLPLSEKISYCMDFYQRRSLPCLFRITPFSRPGELDMALAAASFIAYQDTRVMKLELSDVGVKESSDSQVQSVDVDTFTSAFSMLHGLDAQKTREEQERYSRSAIVGEYVAQFDGDVPIACGTVALDGALAGIFGMVTAAAYRGRGIATRLMSELLSSARKAGALTAYLQVEADNIPARQTYAKFGFEDCYAYWYRTRDLSKDHP